MSSCAPRKGLLESHINLLVKMDEEMSDIKKAPSIQETSNVLTLAEFLETCPPSSSREVTELTKIGTENQSTLFTPELQLHCSSTICGGPRIWESNDIISLNHKDVSKILLTYTCRNCQQEGKLFALVVGLNKHSTDGKVVKIGEWPPFGPPTPSRVVSLVGPDRDAFLKGRRSENQGLGIGAFSYYRRVVENQKNRILDEIIRVAQRLKLNDSLIDDLESAKKEVQFKKSIDNIKHALPTGLLINGHNPLTLLHSALSEGIHAQDDSECLALAQSIRVVLTELAERMGQLLKDETELKAAVSRLMKVPS